LNDTVVGARPVAPDGGDRNRAEQRSGTKKCCPQLQSTFHNSPIGFEWTGSLRTLRMDISSARSLAEIMPLPGDSVQDWNA
jgi:hypothetical protein